MNPELDFLLGALLKVTAVWLLIAAIEVIPRRLEPRWRVLLLRSAMVATPLVLLAHAAEPLIEIASPRVEQATSNATPLGPLRDEVFPESPIALHEAGNSAADSGMSMSQLGVLVWAIVGLGLLARDGFILLHNRGEVRRSRLAPERLQRIWETVCGEYGLRAIPLRQICETKSPYLAPGPRCELVVPALLAEADDELVAHVFRHEAAHLRGRDPYWMLLNRVFLASAWFHPLAWWISSRHLAACEEACDAEAARRGGADSYQSALAKLALTLVPVRTSTATAFLRLPSVVKRLAALPKHVGLRPPGHAFTLAIVGAALLIGGIAGTVDLVAQEAPEVVTNTIALPKTVFEPELNKAGVHDAKSLLEAKGITMVPGADVRYNEAQELLVLRHTAVGQRDTERYIKTLKPFPAKPPTVISAPVDPALLSTMLYQIPKETYQALEEGAGVTSAKELLVKQGVQFPPGASAIYAEQQGVLIMRNNQEEQERLQAWGETIEGFQKPGGAFVENAQPKPPSTDTLDGKLKAVIVPSVEFEKLPFKDAMEYLVEAANNLDPDGKKLNVIIGQGVDADVQVNLKLTNVPLREAIRYTSALARATFQVGEDAVMITPVKIELFTNVYAIPMEVFANSLRERGVPDARGWLGSFGFEVLEGESAIYNSTTGQLIVRATKEHQAIIKEWVQSTTDGASNPPGGESKDTLLITRAYKIKLESYYAALRAAEVESAKDLLSKQGLEWMSGTDAMYSEAQQVMIVRNILGEHEKVLTWVKTLDGFTSHYPVMKDASGPRPDAPAEVKARNIVIQNIEFRELRLEDALEYLVAESKRRDPEQKGINLVVDPGVNKDVPVTLKLSNVPLSEAFRYVTSLAGSRHRFEGTSVVIEPAN